MTQITHTELLAYATEYLQAELDELTEKSKGNPELEAITEGRRFFLSEKLDALKTLYKIETGVDY